MSPILSAGWSLLAQAASAAVPGLGGPRFLSRNAEIVLLVAAEALVIWFAWYGLRKGILPRRHAARDPGPSSSWSAVLLLAATLAFGLLLPWVVLGG